MGVGLVIYTDLGGCTSVVESWFGESDFLVLDMFRGMVSFGLNSLV